MKKLTAWAVKTEDFDGIGIYAARTESGARGYARKQAREAGYEIPLGYEMEVWACYPLDAWAERQAAGRGAVLEHAIRWALEIERRKVTEAVESVDCGEGR